MALDRVQPVPWVLLFWMRRPRNQTPAPSRHSRSSASLIWWPPLHSTAQPYCSLMARAARSIPAGSEMVIPDRTSASGMLGVSRVARGRSFSFRASTASSEMRRAPLVATITGSTTMFRAPYCRSLSAMTAMRAVEDTMPVFTASGKMSVKMQSS